MLNAVKLITYLLCCSVADKRFPSRAKPNVQVLTHSFRADKVDQSRWEVTRDGCLCVSLSRLASLTAIEC